MPTPLPVLQGKDGQAHHRGQPQAERTQAKGKGKLAYREGIRLRGRRCIEPEAVFGQMKYDMAYRRFRHFGKDKVTMDFAFFAIAFNIKKMCRKLSKQGIEGIKRILTDFIHTIFTLLCLSTNAAGRKSIKTAM